MSSFVRGSGRRVAATVSSAVAKRAVPATAGGARLVVAACFTDARAKPLLAPRGCAQPVAQRSMSSLPEHQLLGMPGLSPTMTVGNIVKYHVKVGDKLAAGDMICDIETDKATIGWESMEEGYVAALLVPEGASEVPVGKIVVVVVDSEASVKVPLEARNVTI
ncbi:single hybrid motif-containing protein [Baffinella frigidus]|nr:single hybrid motif-containing protein [Cryptophyta sp. CCMP2293]